MKAIVLQGDKTAKYVTDRSEPRSRPDYVKVNVKAVALNPTDWKHREYDGLNHPGLLSGCDFAGVAAEDTDSSARKQFKKGDRVCGFAHGGNELEKEDGAFAETIVARAGGQMHIPDNWSFEEAAGMGVATITVGQGMYQQMKLNWPNDPIKEPEWILIYGGSSAMGSVGIEFAKLSGYKVVTVCSPRNFDMVKSYGADEAFDYNDPASVEKIKDVTGGGVRLVWDAIALETTSDFCEKVMVKGAHYGHILMGKPKRDDVKVTSNLGYTAAGEEVKKIFGNFSKEDAEKDYDWIIKWVKVVEPLLAQGKIKPHPVKAGKGLEGVIGGMDDMRDEKISGQKLVFTL